MAGAAARRRHRLANPGPDAPRAKMAALAEASPLVQPGALAESVPEAQARQLAQLLGAVQLGDPDGDSLPVLSHETVMVASIWTRGSRGAPLTPYLIPRAGRADHGAHLPAGTACAALAKMLARCRREGGQR